MKMIETKIDVLLTSIQEHKNRKGYTLENMADDLGISHSAYRKTENGQTKITVERLLQISKILDVSVVELLDEAYARIYNQNNSGSGTLIGHQEFENYYHENKNIENESFIKLYKEIELLKKELMLLKNKKI